MRYHLGLAPGHTYVQAKSELQSTTATRVEQRAEGSPAGLGIPPTADVTIPDKDDELSDDSLDLDTDRSDWDKDQSLDELSEGEAEMLEENWGE